MNKKRTEEILSAAFGETQSDLGHLTDAERKELETAKLMRQGLASLKDVPEHQLSNERLRNAILGSTVRQQKRFAPWSYATVAIASLAVALLAIQSINTPKAGTNVAVNSKPGTNVPLANGTNNATAPNGQGSVAQKNNLVKNDSAAVRPSPDNALTLEDVDAEYRQYDGAFSAVLTNMDFGSEEPTMTLADREPVVVVDSATLSDNGAAKAKEVASYGDVVFGG